MADSNRGVRNHIELLKNKIFNPITPKKDRVRLRKEVRDIYVRSNMDVPDWCLDA